LSIEHLSMSDIIRV